MQIGEFHRHADEVLHLLRLVTLLFPLAVGAVWSLVQSDPLHTVVGLAVWPCVRLSIGSDAHSCAMVASLFKMRSSAGSSTSWRAALSISAWLVLLMSSLVQAKCTNSAAARNSA